MFGCLWILLPSLKLNIFAANWMVGVDESAFLKRGARLNRRFSGSKALLLVFFPGGSNGLKPAPGLNLYTPEVSQLAPEKWWLEYYFPFGKVTFQGRAVKIQVGTFLVIWCWKGIDYRIDPLWVGSFWSRSLSKSCFWCVPDKARSRIFSSLRVDQLSQTSTRRCR